MKLENVIYCGDNLTWLKKFPDKCIDLIYLDPPFFSNRNYEVIFNDGEEIRSFEDRWKGGINHYIEWMKDRVFELHRVLKDTGSFYLNCDWHASHYLKIMCDEIFGYNNFRNEIVWCYTGPGHSKKDFQRKHDIILRYSKKNDNYKFNQQYIPYSSGIHVNKKGKVLAYKGTVKESKAKEYEKRGKPVEDWWTDIYPVDRVRRERYGYPTQKPEALLERIIKASSNKKDLVLDPFCGCGTTVAVAQKLQRKWIGIDVSPTACKLMKNRVEKSGARGTEIIGQPLNIEELKALPHFEFQNWCVGALGGTVNPKKVGDKGIDGFSFMHRYPIQVKQSESVGRNVVDNFETAMQRAKQDMGYIIAFSFTRGAYEEVAEAKQRGLHIELLNVDKLLEYDEKSSQGKMF
jgi:DNA modification methylase